MLEPAVPLDEANRLATLRSLDVLDTPPEERFDRLTRLAQHIFDVPIALVSLVDSNRQWFKSSRGLAATETPRSISFCGHAILSDQPFIIPDASADPRFADNPLVADAPHIRFYAGQPLKAADGSRLGTLCVIDSKPRQLTQTERDCLRELALCVNDELQHGSELKRLAELALFQERYASIIASSGDAIISKTLYGIISTWNPAAESLFGYTEEEAVGQPIAMLIPENRRDEEKEILARLKRGERIEHFETVRVSKDGRDVFVSVSISPIRDRSGNIVGASKIVRDLTERNLATQVRREDGARLSAILDNVLDGIITINETGIVESFNKSAERIFGYKALDVIGNNVKMLMPEPYHTEHDGYLHNFMSTGEKKIIGTGRQVIGRRKDGATFPMDLAVSAMQLGSKRMFTGIVRDITDRIKTERMKSEFISTVSHELRTPLTSIRGSLGLLAGGAAGELQVEARTLIDIAYKNSERLILLVNDILDMEKIEAGKMEFSPAPAKLLPLLLQAIEGNRAYAEQFRVTYQLADNLPDVMLHVDANRLQQVMANLLSNAAKFSPAGDSIEVSASADQKCVRVSVSDHGSGIPEQFHDHIFQKFSQADSSDTRKKGGTGLGLSITKAIVEQMGGRIGFDSQPDVLTTFWIEFPIWQARGDSVDKQPPLKKRILICEDDQDIASWLRLLLEQAGLEADVACTAAQAKQMLTQHAYSAMTLDLALPDQSGIQLIRELRTARETVTLPILVVSATAENKLQELNGEAFYVIDWIDQPIDHERLLRVLSQAIEHAPVVRPKILHIEDDPDICHVINAIAKDLADVIQAHTLHEARRMLKIGQYDLAILDISLPDGSGMELLSELNNATPPIPVMVFSAHDMGQNILKKVGASLVKSRTDNVQLLATIRNMVGIE